MAPSTAFKTEFAVAMTCQACVNDVRRVLRQTEGVESYDIDLKAQRVIVEGRAAPSRVSRALKETGRQVIVRGAGAASGAQDAAAVCIFESHTPQALMPRDAPSMQVHGIARLVQAGETTLLDLTVRHHSLLPGGGDYEVFVAKTGDISEGAATAGGVHRRLGRIVLGENDGYGDLFKEVEKLQLWEIIGRAMVIAPVHAATVAGGEPKMGAGILAGVIARSAGLWGTTTANEKTVCSCSGLSMWQEERLFSAQANL